MILGKIADLVTMFFCQLSSDETVYLVMHILYLFGLYGIFRKCGLKGWHALIPCLMEDRLGEAVGMEKEGRVASITQGFNILLGEAMLVVSWITGTESTLYYIIMVLRLFVSIILAVYMIRLYLGLCEVFDRKKGWLILWIFLSFIPAVLWGWMKEYRPLWQAEEMKHDAASYFSGAKAAVLDQGLTVNLEERTTIELLKKKYLLRDMQYDIGFVPQQDLMRGSDTVFRTLMDAATLRLPSSFTRAEREARVNEVLEIFGLSHAKRHQVDKLSGGQRKRLSIAMEFVSNPTLFILDEPDSGLDGVMARELFEQLRRIADQGKIIIVITHTPDRVIDLFDDVIVLAKDAKRTGRLAWFGPVEEARAFFGKEKMEEIVKSVNRTEEGGEGRADEFIMKYTEVMQHV